jgi:dihydrofolate reductase
VGRLVGRRSAVSRAGVRPHAPPDTLTKQGGTTFTFVTDGVESAVAQAREAAGDKDVLVAGGASAIQQCISAGLVDELQVHIAPLLLRSGTRLFDNLGPEEIELEKTRVIDSALVTHLRFRVGK